MSLYKKWQGRLAEIRGSAFSFFSDDEIRRMSVKRIENPISYDNMRNPTEGGLYDPVLGCWQRGESCKTCNLGSDDCPGHFGHVELPAPVYNPMSYPRLLQILKLMCFSCHHFRLHEKKVEKYVEMIRLIACGKALEAMEVERELDTAQTHQSIEALFGQEGKKKKKSKKGEESSAESDSDSEQENGKKPRKPSSFDGEDPVRANMTKNSNAYFRHLFQKFVQSVPPMHCENCKATKLAVKNDQNAKIFQIRPARKNLNEMWAGGIRYPDVTAAPNAERDDVDDRMTRWLWELDEQRLNPDEEAAKRAREAAGEDEDEDLLSESDDDMDVDEDDKKKKKSKKSKKKDAEDEDDEDADDEEDGKTKKKSSKKGKKDAPKEKKKTKKEIEQEDAADLARKSSQGHNQRYMDPSEVEKHMELLWKNEQAIFDLFWGGVSMENGQMTRKSRPNQFFMRVVPVAPSRFRPASEFEGLITEHPQNIYLQRMIELTKSFLRISMETDVAPVAAPANPDEPVRPTKSKNVRMNEIWVQIQQQVNMLLDQNNSSGSRTQNNPPGIKQMLEKKAGLFRQNMMGKRVNFCARSVISPDYNLDTNEIGVPLYFATRLMYPEPVTDYNLNWLRKLVINGPTQHPGAVAVEDQDGNIVHLNPKNKAQRVGIAKTLAKPTLDSIYGAPQSVKRVYRHLVDGDLLILNRQPTLHKPSMMVHKARVLGQEKTIQMHYANCATYNADFDGDEMNIHFVQNELARAEARTIAITDEQYVVPKDGSPIRGLIQDHIVAGVKLTQRDTFLTRSQAQQMLYPAAWTMDRRSRIELPEPAILKPQPLWTGKQLITALLNHMTKGKAPLNLTSKEQIPDDMWGKNSGEGTIIIRANELLTGIIGKKQVGNKAHGLVHAVYEIYGAEMAGKLLSGIGRLFTLFLQFVGFTCGMDDMILDAKTDLQRWAIRKETSEGGIVQAAIFTGIANEHAKEIDPSMEPIILERLGQLISGDQDEYDKWDQHMIRFSGGVTSKTIDLCLPAGQLKPFPANNLAMMTVSGAKGSRVNQSMISCLLGQQELEGKRPPLMPTGRPLPMFEPYDPDPASQGFMASRFLSGYTPAEYYFHCMAGREGLIDTAVKTSRSGYLQRCLIKHMESLAVQYDHTVRDSSDGAVIQFRYGEDGVDVMRTGWLTEFNFLSDNFEAIASKIDPDEAREMTKLVPSKAIRKLQKAMKKKQELPDTLLSKYSPGSYLGSVSEAYEAKLNKYIEENPARFSKDGEEGKLHPDAFKLNMYLKYMTSLAAPGEVVGIVAAQSIGEPSTQMTLNTFHLAGRGDVNVTLGIPRMRELIMTAGNTIKTPSMTLTVKSGIDRERAQRIANNMCRVVLGDVLEETLVKESLDNRSGQYMRVYDVQFVFKSDTDAKFDLPVSKLFYRLENFFIPAMINTITRKLKIKQKRVVMGSETALSFKFVDELVSGRAGDDMDEEAGADDAAEERGTRVGKTNADREEDGLRRGRKNRERDYDDSDDEPEEANDAEANAGEDGESSGPDDAEESGAVSRKKSVAEELMAKSTLVEKYVADKGKRTINITLVLPADKPKINMIELAAEMGRTHIIRSIPGISRAVLLKQDKNSPASQIQTQGINLHHIWRMSDVFDLSKLYTNDVNTVLQYYGIEAARNSLKSEINGVFKAYGISVDGRHLSLVADYMTHEGEIRPMNRTGFATNTSPFLKMSYETTMKFLTEATLFGEYDKMSSPSANICVGGTVRAGTGIFDVQFDLNKQAELMKRGRAN
eukprot:TRINITY_DN826_c0_g3_i2.p1 TRINITY_DN826_c0_g3~~TRINITY_DN826_c0_g3_i2.p1  ORF type:complete len:1768 (+),score=512.87 TRINITY_DN826_c0_g3_i2:109-5412(+)